jgi:hypothetical protein
MLSLISLITAFCAVESVLATGSASVLDRTNDLSPALQSILRKAHTGLYTYPTSLTQGIVPVRFTSECFVVHLQANKSLEIHSLTQRLLERW